MERIKINKTEVVNLLEQGISKEEIREQYYPSLNNNQWKKALNMMGLSSFKVKKIDFLIEDMEVTTPRGNTYSPNNQNSEE